MSFKLMAGDLENDDIASWRAVIAERRKYNLKTYILAQSTKKMGKLLESQNIKIGEFYEFTPDVCLYVFIDKDSRNESAALECLTKTPLIDWFKFSE
jgi:hypothetical protein